MATKSPLAKALKGNQGKLPQALQDAIKAAPESPAKQTKEEASAYMDGLREKRAKKAEKSGDKGRAQRIRSTKDSQDGVESPAKQTKSMQKITRTPETPGEKKAAKRAAGARVASDSIKLYNEQWRYPEWMRGAGGSEARAGAAGEIARKKEAKRSPAKSYGKSPAKQTKPKAQPAPKKPVGPKAEKPKTKKEAFIKQANKKRYK